MDDEYGLRPWKPTREDKRPWWLKGTSHVNEEGVLVAFNGDPVCGAQNKKEPGVCKKPKGWGTDHNGYGNCKLHGGMSPTGKLHAAKEEAVAFAREMVMGLPVDVDPMEALLWCVRITAGEVAYSSYRIEGLSDEDAIVAPQTTLDRVGGRITQEITTHPQELNLWIRVRQQAVDRLARFSKMSLDAGVAQRQVQLAEQAGESLALAIRTILEGLQLSPEQEQKAPNIVRGALAQLEAAGPDTIIEG